MSIIEQAMSHFSSQEVRSMEVPEWKATVWAKPITMAQKGKWLQMAKGSNTAFLLYAVIGGALDKDLKPIFTIEDLDALRHKVDPNVTSGVAMFILGTDSIPEEEQEKN